MNKRPFNTILKEVQDRHKEEDRHHTERIGHPCLSEVDHCFDGKNSKIITGNGMAEHHAKLEAMICLHCGGSIQAEQYEQIKALVPELKTIEFLAAFVKQHPEATRQDLAQAYLQRGAKQGFYKLDDKSPED